MKRFTLAFRSVLLQEDLNFLLTNRIPRSAATRFMGWFSKIESPLLARISIAIWRFFAPLDLSEAKTKKFSSLHECFIRELKSGARTVNPDPRTLVSPCDGIIGEFGTIQNGQLFQAKGFPYAISDLILSDHDAGRWNHARYITIRITSSMYHRFHAPLDSTLRRIRYISGDTWNVNPIALKRVERLFCKNERAILELACRDDNLSMLMIPIAAILVASIRLHCIDTTLNHGTPDGLVIDTNHRFTKGDELGWFEHGSTVILLLPKEFEFISALKIGDTIQMGQPIMQIGTRIQR
jgi:phosphatidylserine decarboxylase